MTRRRWKKRATRSRRAIQKSSAFDPPTAIMTSQLPKTSAAETLAHKVDALKAGGLPAATTHKCEDLLFDVVGLCRAARQGDYAQSALAGWGDYGPCTGISHKRPSNAACGGFVRCPPAPGAAFRR